jgi:hypothetical protein
MSQQLRKLGCIVHTADHGQDCLDFLETTVFTSNSENVPLSIILMDLEASLMLSVLIRPRINYSTDAGNGRSDLRTKNQRVRSYWSHHQPYSRHRYHCQCAERADQYRHGGWYGHCGDEAFQDPRSGTQDAITVV